MKNYMDMKTAFECEDKDIPFIEAGFNFNSKFSKKKLKEYPISTQYVAEIIEVGLSDKWQVEKADPKVLTSKQAAEKYYPKREGGFFYSEERTKGFMDCLFEHGTKNGQSKEWKRLKPLFDDLKKYFIDGHRTLYEKIQGQMMNLTPPWEIDEK